MEYNKIGEEMGSYDKENLEADVFSICVILALIGGAWYGVEKIIIIVKWIISHVNIT